MLVPFSSKCLQGACTKCGIKIGEVRVTAKDWAGLESRKRAAKADGAGLPFAKLKLACRKINPTKPGADLYAAYVAAACEGVKELFYRLAGEAKDSDFAAIDFTLNDFVRDAFGWWQEPGCLSAPEVLIGKTTLGDLFGADAPAKPARQRRTLADVGA